MPLTRPSYTVTESNVLAMMSVFEHIVSVALNGRKFSFASKTFSGYYALVNEVSAQFH
jgi:hypothetical protein